MLFVCECMRVSVYVCCGCECVYACVCVYALLCAYMCIYMGGGECVDGCVCGSVSVSSARKCV